jgi:hypothetical protein
MYVCNYSFSFQAADESQFKAFSAGIQRSNSDFQRPTAYADAKPTTSSSGSIWDFDNFDKMDFKASAPTNGGLLSNANMYSSFSSGPLATPGIGGEAVLVPSNLDSISTSSRSLDWNKLASTPPPSTYGGRGSTSISNYDVATPVTPATSTSSYDSGWNSYAPPKSMPTPDPPVSEWGGSKSTSGYVPPAMSVSSSNVKSDWGKSSFTPPSANLAPSGGGDWNDWASTSSTKTSSVSRTTSNSVDPFAGIGSLAPMKPTVSGGAGPSISSPATNVIPPSGMTLNAGSAKKATKVDDDFFSAMLSDSGTMKSRK